MAAPVRLRTDFDAATLRRPAKGARAPHQSRRLLALAVIHEGGSCADAARIADVGLQTARDWVPRFNADGPQRRGPALALVLASSSASRSVRFSTGDRDLPDRFLSFGAMAEADGCKQVAMHEGQARLGRRSASWISLCRTGRIRAHRAGDDILLRATWLQAWPYAKKDDLRGRGLRPLARGQPVRRIQCTVVARRSKPRGADIRWRAARRSGDRATGRQAEAEPDCRQGYHAHRVHSHGTLRVVRFEAKGDARTQPSTYLNHGVPLARHLSRTRSLRPLTAVAVL